MGCSTLSPNLCPQKSAEKFSENFPRTTEEGVPHTVEELVKTVGNEAQICALVAVLEGPLVAIFPLGA